MMNRALAKGPYFLPPPTFEPTGVDFLGMRQVNFDMMDACIPGINNVTQAIRPFSVAAWIYWKFFHLAERNKVKEPSTEQLAAFKEKVETLFTWGHVNEGLGGLPGVASYKNAQGRGRVSLRFKDWKRSATNTSLMAAAQYGPAMKLPYGLGFLEPVRASFFRTSGTGLELAKALDKQLSRTSSYGLLDSLERDHGSAKDALNLLSGWDVRRPSASERSTFLNAFYRKEAIGRDSRIGRRSTTLTLALRVLEGSTRPLNADEIRERMTYRQFTRGRPYPLESELLSAWYRWLSLQVRQAQRFAMEVLFVWIEYQLGPDVGARTIDDLIMNAQAQINRSHELLPGVTPGKIRKELFAGTSTLDALLANSKRDENYSLFGLMETLDREPPEQGSSKIVPYALRLLIFCAEMTRYLVAIDISRSEMMRGGTDRISLAVWLKAFDDHSDQPTAVLLRALIERLILSQHFWVAAQRFDGNKSRFRIALDEEGLVLLTNNFKWPDVTPDRLFSSLSLLADCRMIKRENDLFSTA